MIAPLGQRLVDMLNQIEAHETDRNFPAEARELLGEAKQLLIHMDQARRHYKRAAELAAHEITKVRVNANSH